MSVTTNNRTYGGRIITGNDLPANAEVVLTCNDEHYKPPKFFVTSRTVDGSITKWTCCDIMSKAEKQLHFFDSDFTNDDTITIGSVLKVIQNQCEFENLNGSGLDQITDNEMEKSACDNITARSVLEAVSEALCGYWFAVENGIKFVSFGTDQFSGYVFAFSEISYGCKRTFSRVICTDGADVYTSGSGENANTLVCSSDYATQKLTDVILGNLLYDRTMYSYRAWSCKGKADYWLYLGDMSFMASTTNVYDELVCNNITLYPSPSGLFFAASRNNVSEDEADYMSEVRRQLERKVELDKINGNAALSKKGLYFFENGYKTKTAEEKKDAKYGFTVDKGVTEYDGAMVSKVTPSSAEINDDGTEATVSYEGKKYKYSIEYDDNGNIKGFAKEEVKEEST
jgi:hypothetical protein